MLHVYLALNHGISFDSEGFLIGRGRKEEIKEEALRSLPSTMFALLTAYEVTLT